MGVFTLPAGASAEEPVLAVLPFRVHSAQPIEYLGESLANLIRTRLETSGEVRVVNAAAVEARAGREIGHEASPSELRDLGRDLGAGYVVTGSLTELAGHYSLDVRVTADVAQPGRTLVLTAEREDELLDRVNEIADGVLSHVVGAAPSVVSRVIFYDADGLEDQLRKRIGTQVGQIYDPATIRDDLTALRSEPAVAQASVETESGPEGIEVHFRIIPAQRVTGSSTADHRGEIVAAVQVRGNRRIEADAIRARIGTRPGEPLNPKQVGRDVREIHSLGFFRDVRVLTEETVSGLVLVFDVEENAVVRQISISGNDNVDGEQIRDILTLTLGSALDYPILFENRARIESLYRAQGYYLAEVGYEVEPLSEASVGIHFIVEENKKLKLRSVEFTGNVHFSDKDLSEDFQTKTWKFWSYATSWFDRSGTYSEPLFLQDLREVEKLYTDAGFIHVQVGEPEVVPSPDGLTVSVPVDEGERFQVGAIDVAGDDSVDIEALRELLELREGDWFSRSFLTEDVASLTEHYTDRGFYFASVQPLSNISDADQTVDIIFEVHKGPLYFVRNIEIAGNTTTIDPVIRREIPIVEGQLYSQREITIAKARIANLGFFEEVDFQVEPTDDEQQIDLDVGVVEKPTGSFSFGAGFSSQDSFVVTGSLQQTNLFGRGYAANVSLDYGGQTQRFFVNLVDPYFLGSNFSLGATFFRTSVQFEDFEQEQTGLEVILGHQLSEDGRSRGFWRYSLANRKIDEDQNTSAASLILRELYQDDVGTSLTGLSFLSDTRDDRLAPTTGYQAGGSVEFAGLGFFSRFLRAEGRVSRYFKAPHWMPEKSTFVVSARAGYALPLNSIDDFDFPEGIDFNPVDGNFLPLEDIDTDLKLPLSERYFLGGLGQFQLRGFKARSVGPRRALLYQDPLSGNFLPVGRVPAQINTVTGEVFIFSGSGNQIPDPDDPFSEFTTVCTDGGGSGGNGNGECNDIDDTEDNDFEDLGDTDVIGGNSFISTSLEYRFPVLESLGLQGILFLDMGNAFQEGDNLFDVREWRYGAGGGLQWFSPFGPLAVIIGFPLDRLSGDVEDSPVFEFSVGGQGF